MNAVIYICHGSRAAAGIEQAENFIKRLLKHSLAPIQEYCFLELAEPAIEKAFINAINQGATRIAVIPVLLLTAAHAKEDIPNEFNRIASRYPKVKIVYGEPIGVHSKMVSLLIERMKETEERLTGDSLVLLTGRGSSDPDVKRDLNKIADMLKIKAGVKHVEACFLTAAAPSFEEGLRTADEGNYGKVFIIPYLLFTGILMKHINKMVETHPSRDKYILCKSLGYHPCIEEILVEKVHSLLNESK